MSALSLQGARSIDTKIKLLLLYYYCYENKNSPSRVRVLHKSLNWSFYVVFIRRTAKKYTKKNARAESLFC